MPLRGQSETGGPVRFGHGPGTKRPAEEGCFPGKPSLEHPSASFPSKTEYEGERGDIGTKSGARRFVWDSRVALAALDLLSIGLLLGIFLAAAEGRLDFSVSAEAPFIFLAGLISNLILVYASGGYSREALLNRQFTTSRLPVALGLAGIAVFAGLHYGMWAEFPTDAVYRSVGRSAIVSLITVGIALGATLWARVVFYAMVRRHLFRRRVLVIGAGKRARHLYELLSHSSHRLASELIFVPGSVVGGSPDNLLEQANGIVVSPAHEALDSLTERLSVDEIVVALDEREGLALENLLRCKARGIRVTEIQSFLERETGRVDLGALESSVAFVLRQFRYAECRSGHKAPAGYRAKPCLASDCASRSIDRDDGDSRRGTWPCFLSTETGHPERSYFLVVQVTYDVCRRRTNGAALGRRQRSARHARRPNPAKNQD